jgi:hypothetical protein
MLEANLDAPAWVHRQRCKIAYKTAIASIMAIPTGATRVRLKIAAQRGQVLALAEIMAPHAGHEVILVMTTQPWPLRQPLSRTE